MKIIVIIPTLNEADSIAFVTKTIDKGLRKISGNPRALIVNSDGGSTDKTYDVFLKKVPVFRKTTEVLSVLPPSELTISALGFPEIFLRPLSIVFVTNAILSASFRVGIITIIFIIS